MSGLPCWTRLEASLLTPFDVNSIYVTAGVLGVLAVIATPIGQLSGFLSFRHAHADPDDAVKSRLVVAFGVVRTFFVPSLLEECFWRACLLPHPMVDAACIGGGPDCWAPYLIPNILFTLGHVASGAACGQVGLTGYRDTFYDPRFLLLAGCVGTAATAAYALTGGCVWAAAVVHWVPVAVWLFVFDGQDRLNGRLPLAPPGGGGGWTGLDPQQPEGQFKQ
uniref:CAAX prenyl protease 2/Lysostaphin resistance protein A-like domain-containing protein n=1 Tax=Cryptomonas curvata TaxID=233186 RepID=A0A7S0MKZ1_9CRYP